MDGKQITFAIAARAQRPAGMCGQRGVDHRVANAAESVAVGIGRLHDHRIGLMLSIGGSTEWSRSRSSFRIFGKFNCVS